MPRRRSGKKIDFVHWTAFQEAFLAQAAGTAGLTAFPALHEPETLLRLRGNLLCYVDTTQAPTGLMQVALGLILVPEGTGTTVLWSPATDGDAPWIWYDIFHVGYEEAVTDVVDIPGITSYRSVIDSKAMRIVRNQEVQLVIESVAVGSTISINAVVSGRALTGR